MESDPARRTSRLGVYFARFGAAAMTPIAVLPAAALLLALGFLFKVFLPSIAFAPELAGKALFNYLGLVFGVGIAVGMAGGEGIAGLSAVVSYVIIDGISKGINPDASIGVLIGLVAGLGSAYLYERFHRVRFSEAMSFFAGQRFVPIITAVASVFVAVPLGMTSPYLQSGLGAAGNWMVGSGVWGVLSYGLIERALIPTGLHHFLNGVVLLLQGNFRGAHGDLPRFFAGDPGAGYFMSGAYPITLFALPAACLAMYHEARKGARSAVKGLFLTAGLTSFLTGITEPVEFSFLFTAPILYAVHVLFFGLSYVATYLLGVRAGFGSASGAVEYIINLPLGQRPLLIIPLGLAWGLVYYGVFRLLIRRLNLATPGRLAEEVTAGANDFGTSRSPLPGAQSSRTADPVTSRAEAVLRAFGGPGNVASVDSCLTRLRVVFRDEDLADEGLLRGLGAAGIVRSGRGVWQVVFGTGSDELKRAIRGLMKKASPPDGEDPTS